MAERICWRCGVRWEPTGYTLDAPCVDCQETTGEVEQKLDHWHVGVNSKILELALQRREADIRALCGKRLSDKQVARRLGINPRTVLRWRTKLGIRPTTTPDIYFVDVEKRTEAVREATHRRMMERIAAR